MIADPFAAFPGAVVLDGGLATELERRGFDLRDELWSARVLLEHPGAIADVHRAYVEAGADVVITASYQASFEGLARRGLDRDAASALLARSVELAREAAAGRARVAASIGPYGAVLADGSEYTGRYGLGAAAEARAALRAFHEPRAAALAAAGPDLLAVETIPSIVEAEAIVAVLGDLGDLPAWVSFSCRDGRSLHDGSSLDDAIDVAASARQVVAVGVNCTAPAHVAELVGRAAARTDRSVVAYPNRGGTWSAAAKAWVGDDLPRGLGPFAGALRVRGARLIGGCCGTGPDDIRAVAAALTST